MNTVLLLLLLLACTSTVFADDDDDTYNFLTVSLKTDANSRYIIPANMGPADAAQSFDFALSMGTPYLSVVGTNCTSCNNSPAYNQTKSTTARSLTGSANVSLIGDGSASGSLISEDCSLPTDNGTTWSYPNQTIVVAANSSYLFNGQVSGIFGLQTGTGNPALFNASIFGGIFNQYPTWPSFTYGLALLPPLSSNPNAGELHWFAADSDAFKGSVTMKNTTSPTSPATSVGGPTTVFDLDGWDLSVVGGNSIQSSSDNLQASLDPYFPAIYFPADQTQLIYAAIDGALSASGDNGQSTVWTIPCGTQFSLSSSIGGKSFSLDQSQLIQKNSDGSCSSYIRGWTDATVELYLFGSSFISSLYLIVHVANPSTGQVNQVGFATRNSETSTPKPVGAIVGGTLGGVVVLAIIAVAVVLIIRHGNKRPQPVSVPTYVPALKVEPFVYPPPPQSGGIYQPSNDAYLQSHSPRNSLLPASHRQSYPGDLY